MMTRVAARAFIAAAAALSVFAVPGCFHGRLVPCSVVRGARSRTIALHRSVIVVRGVRRMHELPRLTMPGDPRLRSGKRRRNESDHREDGQELTGKKHVSSRRGQPTCLKRRSRVKRTTSCRMGAFARTAIAPSPDDPECADV
jgi:hypothetical protein